MKQLFGYLLPVMSVPLAASMQPVIQLCSHACTSREDFPMDTTRTGFARRPLIQTLAAWKNGSPMNRPGTRIGDLFSRLKPESSGDTASE